MLIFPLLLLTGCSKDLDDEELIVDAATFELTLLNNSGNSISVFLKDFQPNAGFVEKGTLAPGEELVIPDLYVRQTYIVRASQLGNSAEDYFYQQSVLRQSPTDLTLTIN